MKVVLLAGGFGTRISDESSSKPKPLLEIGERPIIWHIMKTYSRFGFDDFIICTGYKGHMLQEYFARYYLQCSDVTFDYRAGNECIVHRNRVEPWRVTLVDTGIGTMTGGRLKRVRDYLGEDTFMMTYGDGLSDLDIGRLVDFHRHHGLKATVTSVQPEGRFGSMAINGRQRVTSFQEKLKGDGKWVNGGYFVLEPSVFDYLDGDDTVWEEAPLRRLAADGQLMAFRHTGFWHPMDTPRDRRVLEQLWQSGQAPWSAGGGAP